MFVITLISVIMYKDKINCFTAHPPDWWFRFQSYSRLQYANKTKIENHVFTRNIK